MAYKASAKVLPIRLTLGTPTVPNVKFNATITVSDTQIHSSDASASNTVGLYTGRDVSVGDYICTSQGGRVLKIESISAQTIASVTCVVEDEMRQNSISSANAVGTIDEDDGVLFEVHNGRPILFPLPAMPRGGLLNNWASEVQSRFDYFDFASSYSPSGTYPGLAVGDLVTWDSGNSEYVKLDATTTNDHIGTVTEKFTDNSIRIRPTGPVIDITLGGNEGDIWYVDQSNPGGVTRTRPTTGRVEYAYFQISANLAIYIGGTRDSGEFLDLTSNQTAAGDKTFSANVTIDGNLTVSGTTTTVNTTNTTISDSLLELGTGTTGTPTNDSGIVIERGDQLNIFIGFDESAGAIVFGQGNVTGSSTGNLTIQDVPVALGSNIQFTNSSNANVGTDMHVLYGTTTNATETTLSNSIAIPNLTTAMFQADVVARDSAGTQHCGYKLSGVVDNTSNSLQIVGTVVEEIIAESDVNWTATAEAGGTSGDIEVLGAKNDPSFASDKTYTLTANGTTYTYGPTDGAGDSYGGNFYSGINALNVPGLTIGVHSENGFVNAVKLTYVPQSGSDQLVLAATNGWDHLSMTTGTYTSGGANQTLDIKVTGEASTTIRWTAFVKLTSVTH